jgi:HAMP domain-containing protein
MRLLARNLSVLSLVALAGFAIVWFAGNAMIARPVEALTEASKRMAAGDLSVRSGLGNVPGEFGHLARMFDATAAALERGQGSPAEAGEAAGLDVRGPQREARSEAIIAGIGDGINIGTANSGPVQKRGLKAHMGDRPASIATRRSRQGRGLLGCVVSSASGRENPQGLTPGRMGSSGLARGDTSGRCGTPTGRSSGG